MVTGCSMSQSLQAASDLQNADSVRASIAAAKEEVMVQQNTISMSPSISLSAKRPSGCALPSPPFFSFQSEITKQCFLAASDRPVYIDYTVKETAVFLHMSIVVGRYPALE